MIHLRLAALGAVCLWAAAAEPQGPVNWPQFRGADGAGIADSSVLPARWSATENVPWSAEVPGRGWSSPIVWGDRVYVTTAVNAGGFKAASTGIYGNDYAAELKKQGLSDDEILKRVTARDIELASESEDVSYEVLALDARTGQVVWQREAHRGKPSGGRHRKNTYASETPATDGERVYASFGGNVGLFCYSREGALLWKQTWAPQPIYLDFGTASSPVVHDGRVYQLHDNAGESFLAALEARTGEVAWKVSRTASEGRLKSGWATPFVWANDLRTEIVTVGRGLVISYDTQGRELWRLKGITQATPSPVAGEGLLFVGKAQEKVKVFRTQRRRNPGTGQPYQLQAKRKAARAGESLSNSTERATWSAADEKTAATIRDRMARLNPRKFTNPAISETLTVQVEISADAALGQRELRVWNPLALSNPMTFCVSSWREILEKESPDESQNANERRRFAPQQMAGPRQTDPESITLPAVINGQIMPGDVDRFRFRAQKGQKLVFVASARNLIPYLPDAVPGWFQATLGLYHSKGKEVAYDDDFRFNPDPVIFFHVPASGDYVLEIKDSIYRGREDFVYRVECGEMPFVTGIFPLGGQADREVSLELKGWKAKKAVAGEGAFRLRVDCLPLAADVDCAGAVPLQCDRTVAGDLALGQARQDAYQCSTDDYAGREQVYYLDLAAPTNVAFDLTELSGDPDLILINDGTGKLTRIDQPLEDADSTAVALGDVNGDGRLDALVGTSNGARLWINQGGQIASGGAIFAPSKELFKAERTAWEALGGGFSAAAERLVGLYLPYGRTRTKAVFLEDLDGDGDRDALIARLWWADIWWNDGQGDFSRSDARFEYPEDTGVAVADFDGDGDVELFAAGNGEKYKVWLNDGQGVFRGGMQAKDPG